MWDLRGNNEAHLLHFLGVDTTIISPVLSSINSNYFSVGT